MALVRLLLHTHNVHPATTVVRPLFLAGHWIHSHNMPHTIAVVRQFGFARLACISQSLGSGHWLWWATEFASITYIPLLLLNWIPSRGSTPRRQIAGIKLLNLLAFPSLVYQAATCSTLHYTNVWSVVNLALAIAVSFGLS